MSSNNSDRTNNRGASDSPDVHMNAENINQTEGSNFKIMCPADEKTKAKEDDSSKIEKNLSKILKIEINKPLIPLKIAIFCWFAGCAAIGPFIGLYLKQRGLTLRQISVIYIITPIIQLFGPSLSGIVADKLGRSKPVLQANLLIALISANCMLFIPGVKNTCFIQSVNCSSQSYGNASVLELCNIQRNSSYVTICTFNCSSGQFQRRVSDVCFENYISSCYFSSQEDEFGLDNETAPMCIQENLFNEENNTFCDRHVVSVCNLTCTRNAKIAQKEVSCQNNVEKNHLFILSLISLIVFQTFLSNVYRIFDVTAMSMIKTHKSDFGRQRVWAITGAMIFSPLAGFIISLVSPKGGPPRYDVPFYIYDVTTLVTILIVWKLDVKIDPPGKDMLKKTLMLIKNIDILVFIITIFVIGTAWGFTKLFSAWHLEDLGAPSTLLGLLTAVGSLTGLPFLFTSNWFVQKLGSSTLLLFCLIGYTVLCIGYSFLVNPWYALIYQLLEIPNYHLLWVTVVTYSHATAPSGLKATVIATAGGIHFGVGKGTGSLVGGIVMSKYGGRMAYRVIAAMCAVTAALYALYVYCRGKYKKQETHHKDADI